MNIDDLTVKQLREIKSLMKPNVATEIDGRVRIVILQRGWVMIGYYKQKGSHCWLDRASVMRNWGTSKGLGEIAAAGPTVNTKLDPTNGRVEFHEMTVVATLQCEEEKWVKHLI